MKSLYETKTPYNEIEKDYSQVENDDRTYRRS